MRRSLILIGVVALATTALAGPRHSMRISMIGIPEGHRPEILEIVAGNLAADVDDPIRTEPVVSEWFWEQKPATYAAEIVFERFYGGREQRTLIPMLAARYAYRVDASGYISITSYDGDTVHALVPFDFSWQKPVKYQLTGVQPRAASVQFTAPETVKLESAAMEALGIDLARSIRHGLRRAREADDAP